jgi:hypothetical protein
MATQDTTPVSMIAGADLSGSLFKFGKLNSSGQVVVCSVLGERASCVIYSKPKAAGDGMDGAIDRIALVESAAVFNPGTRVSTDANGRAVAALTTHFPLGEALDAGEAVAGSTAKLIRVRLHLAVVPLP